MATWVECRPFGKDEKTKIFLNLDQVVCLSGDDRATVVRYGGNGPNEFVVAGPARDLLDSEKIKT